jgi:hypothetical protein
MPTYEFHISTGASAQTNKAIRSHAIKTALQLRSKSGAGKESPDSSEASAQTAQRKKELRGQFRIKTATTNPGHRLEGTHQEVIRYDGGSMSVAANMNKSMLRSNYLSGVPRFSVDILDPFGAIPIPSNPNIDTLLKHCMSYSFLLALSLLTNPSHGSFRLLDYNSSKQQHVA